MARILIIEDDEQVRLALKQMLEREGYDVTEARNGRVGVDLQKNDPFDLVVTDLIMPDQEGLETISILRRDYAELKIIAVSGGGLSAPGPFLKMAQEMGADHSLGKPFRMAEMLSVVKDLLNCS